MIKIIAASAALFLVFLSSSGVLAYTHANSYGGSTSHTYGSTSHTSAYGTSSSHTYGQGSSHTNYYGGSTSHSYYGGTTHTNTYGHTSSAYYGYHPPTTSSYYHGTGCYNCGGWAAAGAAAGYAAGKSAGYASAYSTGEEVVVLPSGCSTTAVGGVTYYNCGGTYFQPAYGANGTYYTVVNAP